MDAVNEIKSCDFSVGYFLGNYFFVPGHEFEVIQVALKYRFTPAPVGHPGYFKFPIEKHVVIFDLVGIVKSKGHKNHQDSYQEKIKQKGTENKKQNSQGDK